jgi:pSer/pThr/pTyr-binding forkhead associated (FHA) protein
MLLASPATSGGTAVARYLLAIVDDSDSSREIDLDAPLEIGRDPDAGLVLTDDLQVSRRHARLTPEEEGVLVEDLGSRNGTEVNGHRLSGSVLAHPGDRIVIGKTTIEVHHPPHTGYLLVVLSARKLQLPLVAPIEVGRDGDVGLALVDDLLVSSRHARLTPSSDGVLVEDLESRNGTFINGIRIEEPTHAGPGDRILIGETELELREFPQPGYVLSSLSGADSADVLLVDPLEIGRDPEAGLVLADDQLVSFRHARVTPTHDGLILEDLGSSNGTFVNGARIKEPTVLRFGDRLVIGATQLEVRQAMPVPTHATLVRPLNAMTRASTGGPAPSEAAPAAPSQPFDVTIVRQEEPGDGEPPQPDAAN